MEDKLKQYVSEYIVKEFNRLNLDPSDSPNEMRIKILNKIADDDNAIKELADMTLNRDGDNK